MVKTFMGDAGFVDCCRHLQIPIGAYQQLAIGKRKTTGVMGVTSELPYFAEDQLCCPLDEMNASSIQYWHLFATDTNSSNRSTVVANEAMINARQHCKGYILDIDLDYFSTWNPFRKDLESYIGDLAVKTVTRVFANVRYKRDSLTRMAAKQRMAERKTFCELMKRLETAAATEDTSTRRSKWAQIRSELVVLYAEDIDAEKLLGEFEQVLEKYRDDEFIRREIWAVGPFLDIPHHESSQQEIERMVSELEQFLRTHALDESNPPAIVTIATSTSDEYLPPHQLDTVLPSVLHMLERVYGEVAAKYVEYES